MIFFILYNYTDYPDLCHGSLLAAPAAAFILPKYPKHHWKAIYRCKCNHSQSHRVSDDVKVKMWKQVIHKQTRLEASCLGLQWMIVSKNLKVWCLENIFCMVSFAICLNLGKGTSLLQCGNWLLFESLGIYKTNQWNERECENFCSFKMVQLKLQHVESGTFIAAFLTTFSPHSIYLNKTSGP